MGLGGQPTKLGALVLREVLKVKEAREQRSGVKGPGGNPAASCGLGTGLASLGAGGHVSVLNRWQGFVKGPEERGAGAGAGARRGLCTGKQEVWERADHLHGAWRERPGEGEGLRMKEGTSG